MRRFLDYWPDALAVLVLALVGLFIWQSCQQPDPLPESGMSPRTERLVDSLDRTDTTVQRKLREAEATAAAERERRRSAERAASIARDSAEHFVQLARAATTARDSADNWRQAYEQERARGDSLQGALDAETRSGAAIRLAEVELKDRVRKQVEAMADLRADLKARTAELSRSRGRTKVAFVAGTATGVLLTGIVRSAARQ